MRSFVCGQCHVEYYCATKGTLEFPRGKGLKMEQLEAHWDEKKFPDGTDFYDYKHGETGAEVLKVQHPEFELWTQGILTRSGVCCSDCHMPYECDGAMKVSSQNVQSPLANINNDCQQCHDDDEKTLHEKVETIQGRTMAHMDRAATAMTDMLDAILEAKAAGATEQQLAPIYPLQRKSMWRLDYISSRTHGDSTPTRKQHEALVSRSNTAGKRRLWHSGSAHQLCQTPVIFQ
ncbi:MAG: ammonia-forming cytochrome c nitrite reductase subunit c552 [Phycisphaerales bacterium]